MIQSYKRGVFVIKKLLYILLIIYFFSIGFIFFALLGTSVLYSVLSAILGLIGLIPIFALISCLDDIEKIKYTQNKLLYQIKKLEDTLTNNPDTENPIKTSENIAINLNKDTARGVWECVKCGTVNKAETDCCSNCKAPYSPWVNPTDGTLSKKKISRWVK